MRRSATAGVRLLATIAMTATLLSACQPIVPAVDFEHSDFEGFEVISYVPEQPRGMIYLFHGSGGSAAFAEKVETVDVLNTFTAAGYGFVSTSSTERTGARRWNPRDASLSSNPDLARLVRLQAELVESTPLEPETPLIGIGHSNGSRFVTLWGQTWSDAGYPVRAIWASAGRIAAPVVDSGGLEVPTFFATAANDFTVPPGPIVAGYEATAADCVPAELFISQERRLNPLPYLRVPGIDADEADGIVAALEATGVWDASGARVVTDIEAAVAQAQTATLPTSVLGRGLSNDIRSETAIILAIHQFSAEYKFRALDFIDAALES